MCVCVCVKLVMMLADRADNVVLMDNNDDDNQVKCVPVKTRTPNGRKDN